MNLLNAVLYLSWFCALYHGVDKTLISNKNKYYIINGD